MVVVTTSPSGGLSDVVMVDVIEEEDVSSWAKLNVFEAVEEEDAFVAVDIDLVTTAVEELEVDIITGLFNRMHGR